MFGKIVAIAAFVAYAQAGVFELGHDAHHHASSYATVAHHAAPVAHAAYAHAPAHYAAAPVAAYHAAPAIVKTHVAPVVKAVHHEVYPDAHPHYAFNYGVQDGHTGDHKTQHEERDGDAVHGEYSIVQPDGITRTVHYSADDHNGFNAHVEYSGHAVHAEPIHKAVIAKAAIPVAHAHALPAYHAYHH